MTQWTYDFDALAERVKDHTPEWAQSITWISADNIRAAARLFAQTKPAMLEWGCAIEHTPKCIQTVRAVSMLPALQVAISAGARFITVDGDVRASRAGIDRSNQPP